MQVHLTVGGKVQLGLLPEVCMEVYSDVFEHIGLSMFDEKKPDLIYSVRVILGE